MVGSRKNVEDCDEKTWEGDPRRRLAFRSSRYFWTGTRNESNLGGKMIKSRFQIIDRTMSNIYTEKRTVQSADKGHAARESSPARLVIRARAHRTLCHAPCTLPHRPSFNCARRVCGATGCQSIAQSTSSLNELFSDSICAVRS